MASRGHRPGSGPAPAGAGAGRGRARPGQPEPAGRRGARPRRRGDRRGLSRRAGRPACRGRGDRGLPRAAAIDPAGATMYVTLEPCAHHGRQPPCTDAILAAGIARVVIGSDDPSEKASGRGPGILRDEGVEVEFVDGAEAAAARLLNQPFRKHARTGRPLVDAEVGDQPRRPGRRPPAATRGGSRARRAAPLVHRWRAESDAVCVGIGTALADDPLLTARDVDDRCASRPGSCSTPRRGSRSTRALVALDRPGAARGDRRRRRRPRRASRRCGPRAPR